MDLPFIDWGPCVGNDPRPETPDPQPGVPACQRRALPSSLPFSRVFYPGHRAATSLHASSLPSVMLLLQITPTHSAQLPTTTQNALAAHASLTHMTPPQRVPKSTPLPTPSYIAPLFRKPAARSSAVWVTTHWYPFSQQRPAVPPCAPTSTPANTSSVPCPLARIPLESHLASPTRPWFLYF